MTKLYWIQGPWPGRLAIAARPRGGDWLDDELESWRQAGVDHVLSLLSRDEEKELQLQTESARVKQHAMQFGSLPIRDRDVPNSELEIRSAIEALDAELSQGKNVVVHCRQGVGRSGLLAACLFISKGWDAAAATKHVAEARKAVVPETIEQRRWIEHFAGMLAQMR